MKGKSMAKKASVTLPGTVQKIIKPSVPGGTEKAEIDIKGADDLYREIRIKNSLHTPDGKGTRLKKGGEVEVTVEANQKATNPKKK
jgi:hypothetical protein